MIVKVEIFFSGLAIFKFSDSQISKQQRLFWRPVT